MIEFAKNTLSIHSQREFEIPLGYRFLPSNIYGIFGPNGIGKTTLLNQILQDINSNIPSIIRDINSNKINNSDEKIAVIPQKIEELLLPWLTPSKMIKIFNNNYSQNKNNSDFLRTIQKKYHFRKLSGGEKQVFAIDLITSYNFDFLFFDEPFSSLDFDNTSQKLIRIKQYIKSNNAILFIVLHDFSSLQYISDHLVFFNPSINKIFIKKNEYIIDDIFLLERKIDTNFIKLCLKETR
ncbi:MAG: ABC transporter ATP-binding protein [Bacteroidales bacterium]|jgi:ABC-type multidrug transport system ATPase subunit|nr:ABC transporter ATP-binding protein [Bacteroidales bacterium]